ncbi:protein O-linked-mannose beta-1,2-N-acetylglucosaminyltransferase 1-like isoform X2 [Hyalella azteca]|uniref:Alpha-1,3-mannosyl-glycoprotein 2-beta-N-acetylglucosaminyltransferase n=1 Tax=Hyalella azteca TaxID=294128 RepID=A0A979FG45_HYAAZ|nr:protein O-linked-mannose beta-1,2-N-acetylglucosaminyltransferase 1-like isoform X2 [Hyalella azteca]
MYLDRRNKIEGWRCRGTHCLLGKMWLSLVSFLILGIVGLHINKTQNALSVEVANSVFGIQLESAQSGHRILEEVRLMRRNGFDISRGWYSDQRGKGSHQNESLDSSKQKEGLVMLVKNPATLQTTFSKVFRTNELFGFYMDVQWHLRRIQNGSLILFVVSASGTAGLRDAASDFSAVGSLIGHHLPAGAHWVWVFVKGGRTLLETAVLDKPNSVLGHLHIPKAQLEQNTALEIFDEKRFKFCRKYDSMGEFCDFDYQRPLLNSDKRYEILTGIPFIITAGNRPDYLFESLTSLMKSPGFQPQNLHVLIGGDWPQTEDLLDIFNFTYSIIPIRGEGNFMRFLYYRQVFSFIVENFPLAPAAILMDEDVRVSPDFFSYFAQVLPVLLEDDSLFCATAFGHLAMPTLFSHKDKVRRGDMQVGWGYAIKLTAIKEALLSWPADGKSDRFYDSWLYYEHIVQGECIFPEVSRVIHFGIGLNAVGTRLETYDLVIDMETESGVHLTNIMDIPLQNWKLSLKKILEDSTLIYGDPCEKNFFTERKNGSYIFSYRCESNSTDFTKNLMLAGDCACKLSFVSTEFGWHDGVTLLRVKPGVDIYFLGVPHSSYSYFAVNESLIWDFEKLSNESQYKIWGYVSFPYQRSAWKVMTDLERQEFLRAFLGEGKEM